MITQENQWNEPFWGKNLGSIWSNYLQGKNKSTIRELKFLQSDLTLNLLLPPVITYWHDHVQVSNSWTSSLLGFIQTQAALLVTLRSHSKVLDHHQK